MPSDNNFTMRLAREGDTLVTAEDYRLIFNAKWPTIPIIAHGLIPSGTQTSMTKDVEIYRHGLGHRTAFITWQDYDSTLVSSHTTGPVSFLTNDALDIAGQFRVDANSFYLERTPLAVTTSGYSYYYMILDINLDELFTTEKISSNSDRKSFEPISKQTRSFKVINDDIYGKDDTRRYSVNSNMQPLMLHSVTPLVKAATGFAALQVEHNLNYPPAFLVFGRTYGNAGGYKKFEFSPESSIGAFASVNSETFDMSLFAAIECSVVLLKDPVV